MDIRDAFFDCLYDIAQSDERVILLTDDMGAFSLKRFAKDIPRQYYNIGIAEQNAVAVAAGLALAGKRPYLFGIAAFMAMRCFEQIKVNLSCMNLPVTIVGSGPGLTYGSDGPTHHAAQDVAILRALPDIAIYNTTDHILTRAIVELTYEDAGPSFVRLEKGILPEIYKESCSFSDGFDVPVSGVEPLIISSGAMTHTCQAVAKRLREEHGLKPRVLDLFRIKPVDRAKLTNAIAGARSIITVEDHSVVGGLGDLIGEIVLEGGLPARMLRLGLPDEHTYAYGNRDWLHSHYGLDTEGLTSRIAAWHDAD